MMNISQQDIDNFLEAKKTDDDWLESRGWKFYENRNLYININSWHQFRIKDDIIYKEQYKYLIETGWKDISVWDFYEGDKEDRTAKIWARSIHPVSGELYTYDEAVIIARYMNNDDSNFNKGKFSTQINKQLKASKIILNLGDVIIRDFDCNINEFKIREIRPITESDLVESETVDERIDKLIELKIADQKSNSCILCNHANEVPMSCDCSPDCYCKSHTCKPKD